VLAIVCHLNLCRHEVHQAYQTNTRIVCQAER